MLRSVPLAWHGLTCPARAGPGGLQPCGTLSPAYPSPTRPSPTHPFVPPWLSCKSIAIEHETMAMVLGEFKFSNWQVVHGSHVGGERLPWRTEAPALMYNPSSPATELASVCLGPWRGETRPPVVVFWAPVSPHCRCQQGSSARRSHDTALVSQPTELGGTFVLI